MDLTPQLLWTIGPHDTQTLLDDVVQEVFIVMSGKMTSPLLGPTTDLANLPVDKPKETGGKNRSLTVNEVTELLTELDLQPCAPIYRSEEGNSHSLCLHLHFMYSSVTLISIRPYPSPPSTYFTNRLRSATERVDRIRRVDRYENGRMCQ